MNKIHRIIWSTAHNAWVVCSEISKAHGKSSSTARKLLAAAIILPTSALAADNTLPSGGQITAGQGDIAQSANTLNINQRSQNLATDWQSFSIGQDATVNFNQPNSSAVALNRVTGNDPSRILGKLNANGQVFLENGNGIVFGKNAQLNVGGLVASTQAISADGNGKYRIDGSSNAAIENLGKISAKNGGTVALIANQVDNSGTINAANGNVRLTAAEAVTLKLQDGSLTDYRIERGALDALVDNGGAVIADGGVVHLTAEGKGALRKAAVNHSGKIEANAVSRNDKGEIILLADMQGGSTDVSGSLIADGGGFIEASASTVNIADSADINTGGGTFLIDPHDFVIDSDKTKGNITGTALGGLLANNDITLQTVANGGKNCADSSDCSANKNTVKSGNLFVNDAVTWASDKKLTLEADDSIYINQEIKADNPDAKVALVYGKDASKTKADYFFGANGKITFADAAAGADEAAHKRFSTKKGGSAEVQYIVITKLGDEADANNPNKYTLQGLAHHTQWNGKFALGANIDAVSAGAWRSGDGFTIIANAGSPFTGTFTGLGHTIDNLKAHRTGFVGLFDTIDYGAEIRNIGMTNADTKSKNDPGNIASGILVGLQKGGIIHHSYAKGTVKSEGNHAAYVGGLVGWQEGGTISHSYTKAIVTGTENSSITGGLVGRQVSGSISNSYATGTVNGKNGVGGLVGEQYGEISNSYTTGTVSGINGVGGLVGKQYGEISNSYATATVSGNNDVGGLVGEQYGDISNSYATGTVNGNTNIGGLVGNHQAGNITESFWDEAKSNNMCGNTSNSPCDDAQGKTSTELQKAATFSGWDGKIWVLKDNAYPDLKNAGVTTTQPESTFEDKAPPAAGGGGKPTVKPLPQPKPKDNVSGTLCFAATPTLPRKCFTL